MWIFLFIYLLFNRNKAILELNNINLEYSSFKRNKDISTSVNKSNQLVLNAKYSSMSKFKSYSMLHEIPTIERSASNNIKKKNNIIECKNNFLILIYTTFIYKSHAAILRVYSYEVKCRGRL